VDLFAAIAGSLRTMFGGDDLDRELISRLLKTKRLLVIVDGLSERATSTQDAVRTLFERMDIGALVITARQEYDFGSKSSFVLTPRPIAGGDLTHFIEDYFAQPSVHEDLSARQAATVARSVLRVFTERPAWREVTPLIATLVAEQAADSWRRGTVRNPVVASALDAVLAYVVRLNPKGSASAGAITDDVVIAAARQIANCCLGDTFTPKEFFSDAAQRAVEEDRGLGDAASIVDRLIQNGVLEEDAHLGTSFLRFSLEPVAEYLAAMYWLDQLRSDNGGWDKLLQKLRAAPGFPEGTQGFCAALEECVASHGAQFNVPPLVLPRPESSTGSESQITT